MEWMFGLFGALCYIALFVPCRTITLKSHAFNLSLNEEEDYYHNISRRGDAYDIRREIYRRILSKPLRFHGMKYFVTKIAFREYHAAVQFCRIMGQTIVEIDKPSLHIALRTQMNKEDVSAGKLYAVYTGLNDIRAEGRYVFEVSKLRPQLFDWDCEKPNGYKQQNCIGMVEWCFWGMTDIPCERNQRPTGVICAEEFAAAGSLDPDDILPVFFYSPFIVDKVKFFISRVLVPDIRVAITICKMAGGGLAEIDNWGKLNALRGALKSNYLGENFRHVYIGGSDEDVEGKWKYADGREMSFKEWLPGSPSLGTFGNCLVLKDMNQMVDAPCKRGTLRHIDSFVCQIKMQ